MDKFSSLQAFCKVVELNGFSAAARELSLSSTMVSKHVAYLERCLGVTLLNRTTRKVSVTEAGGAYYQRSKQLLEDLEEMDAVVSSNSGAMQGVLKINAPVDFGSMHMVPVADAFQQLYPMLVIELTLENRYIDLREGSHDIVIRITNKPDPSLIAKKLASVSLGVYVSPDYLSKNGEPKTPEDLRTHACLHFLGTPHGDFWVFEQDKSVFRFQPQQHFSSNNGRVLCEAASRSMGIIQVPNVSARPYVRSGELVEILNDFRPPSGFIFATYLQRRFIPAKISTFARFMESYYHNLEGWIDKKV